MNEGVGDVQTVASRLINMHAGRTEFEEIIHRYV